MQNESNFKPSLVDSALIVASFTGACYAVGYIARIRRARELGLTIEMLPPIAVQPILLSGLLNLLLWLLVIGLIATVIVACTFWLWQPGRPGRMYLQKAYKNHRMILILLILSIIYILMNFLILRANLPLVNPWLHEELNYSTVIAMQLKDDKEPVVQIGVRLITITDKWLLLRTGDHQFKIVTLDSVKSIQFGPK